MATSTFTTGASAPRLVDFVTPTGDTGFAIRRADGQFWAANRWRGFRLFGAQNKRAGAQLVAGDRRIRARLVDPSESF